MGSLSLTGILDNAVMLVRLATLISKGALNDGSSKHGNTVLA